jgi:PhnB protein
MNDSVNTLIPALAVNDGAKAIAFYQQAFGATELYRLIDPESGKIGHAELQINGSTISLSDEYPTFNKTPLTLGGTAVKFSLMVDDVDVWIARSIAAGAIVVRPPSDEFYGHRSATIRDPFGHEWMLQQEIQKVSPAQMQRRWDAMVKKT